MPMTLNELIRDRGRFFWVLNIAGWSGYVLTAYLGALAHEKPDSYIAVIMAMAVAGFLLTIPMRLLYRRLWERSPVTIGAGVIVTSYFLAFGWRWFSNTLYYEWVKGGWQPEGLMDYVGGVMGSFYILLCWSGLYFGIKYYQQLQDQTERTLHATAAAHQAQLKMLRYQLNPHFLFNTLNAISTLILDGANETADFADFDATQTGDVTDTAQIWSYPIDGHCCSTPAISNCPAHTLPARSSTSTPP